MLEGDDKFNQKFYPKTIWKRALRKAYVYMRIILKRTFKKTGWNSVDLSMPVQRLVGELL
jgi:hypothetical protein